MVSNGGYSLLWKPWHIEIDAEHDDLPFLKNIGFSSLLRSNHQNLLELHHPDITENDG